MSESTDQTDTEQEDAEERPNTTPLDLRIQLRQKELDRLQAECDTFIRQAEEAEAAEDDPGTHTARRAAERHERLIARKKASIEELRRQASDDVDGEAAPE